MEPEIDPKLLEPVYGKTGKGFLKSAGVDELREVKEREKAKPTKGR